MRSPPEPGVRDDFLVRIARFHRSNACRSVCLLLSVSFAGVGTVLLLYPVYRVAEHGWLPVLDDLALGLLGFVGIFAAWFIRVTLCLSRVSHEVLLRLDDDYSRAYRTEAEGQEEGAIRKSGEDGSSVHLLSKSELRELSMRDLTTGWRLLVMVPLVVGGLLVILSIGAWQTPSLGALIFQNGVRLEYLCLGGIVLMMIGAYLLAFGGVVCRRACKHGR